VKFGVRLGGTVYRRDEVPLPPHPLLPADYPGDHTVPAAIEGRLFDGAGAALAQWSGATFDIRPPGG
jgi:hypothetical protein